MLSGTSAAINRVLLCCLIVVPACIDPLEGVLRSAVARGYSGGVAVMAQGDWEIASTA